MIETEAYLEAINAERALTYVRPPRSRHSLDALRPVVPRAVDDPVRGVELYELDSQAGFLTPEDFAVSRSLIGDLQKKSVRAVVYVGRSELRPAIGDIEENAMHQAAITAINNVADPQRVLSRRFASLFGLLPSRHG